MICFNKKKVCVHCHSTRQKLKSPFIVIPSIAEGYSHEPSRDRSLHSLRSVEMTDYFFCRVPWSIVMKIKRSGILKTVLLVQPAR